MTPEDIQPGDRVESIDGSTDRGDGEEKGTGHIGEVLEVSGDTATVEFDTTGEVELPKSRLVGVPE